jgi:hypothetical protein
MQKFFLKALVLSNAWGFAASASSLSTDAASESYEVSLTEVPTESRATYGDDGSVTYSVATSTANVTVSSSTITSGNTTTTVEYTSTYATRTTLAGTSTRATESASSNNGAKCNGYSEFCDRKYSNVTYVVTHNSPFHILHNAASNQIFNVTTQLDDGIRGLQSETHYVNDTVVLCHTSCKELYAGTLEEYLVKVKSWLDNNRLEVITILLGNEDYIDPGNYTAPVTNAGLMDYIYTPPTQPMDIDDWPTLGDMIISNKRVVMMLEYDANQNTVPWLLDMWSYQWQTPFSPTNVSFPCVVQRPPGQKRDVSERRLMLANHNLNLEVNDAALGVDFLIPNTAVIDNTNANTTDLGAAKLTIDQCTAEWGRPPNYLLVDYYNFGNFNGSTLAAAAEANNVTYNVDSCCDKYYQSAGSSKHVTSNTLAAGAAALIGFLMWTA